MTVSDVVADRVRTIRKEYGWKPADLARRCAHIGAPWLTENTIENIESGRRDKNGRRRRDITVDELLALAVALDVAPVHLLVPTDEGVFDPKGGRITVYPVTAEVWTMRPQARNWIRGYAALSEQDLRRYYSHVPEGEFKPPFVPDDDEIAAKGAWADIVRQLIPESGGRERQEEPEGGQQPGEGEAHVDLMNDGTRRARVWWGGRWVDADPDTLRPSGEDGDDGPR